MSTIMDVAKLAGFSRTTVSRVINNNGPVSKEAREKIEKAMKELNYSPNFFAQGMRTNRTRTIVALVPDYANPFYSDIFKSIEDAACKNDYMLSICSTDQDPEKEIDSIQRIIQRNIDGIICFTYNRQEKNLSYLLKIAKEIPIVFMDKILDSDDISCVLTDGFKGTREAITYLLGKDKRRIAYIKGSAHHRVTGERFAGYQQALADFGIEYDEKMVYDGDFHLKSGYQGAEKLMSLEKPPEAIVAATDLMAFGVLKYLKKAGIKVPDEVNVVGFDNISINNIVEPTLTTYAQPIEKLGKEAVRILLNKIENPSGEEEQLILEGKLIIRDSTE